MPAKTVKAAIDELRNAVQSLEHAIDGRFDRERDFGEFESEVRRVNTDRSRLAQELDQSQFRANRLEEVNREVEQTYRITGPVTVTPVPDGIEVVTEQDRPGLWAAAYERFGLEATDSERHGVSPLSISDTWTRPGLSNTRFAHPIPAQA